MIVLPQQQLSRPLNGAPVNRASRQFRAGLTNWYPLHTLEVRDELRVFDGGAWSPSTPSLQAISHGGNAPRLAGASGSNLGPTNRFLTASQAMMMAWIRPSSVASSDHTNIWDGRGIIANSGQYIGLYQWRTGGVSYLSAYNWDGNDDEARGPEVTINRSTHVALVHTGGTLYLFVDGRLFASTASGNTELITADLYIGFGSNGTTGYFEGHIWDVRFSSVPGDYERVIWDAFHAPTRYDLYQQPGRRLEISATPGSALFFNKTLTGVGR